MGAVGIVGRVAVFAAGGDDVGVPLAVMLCKAEGGGLGRGGLQIIQLVVVHLLIVAEPFTHVVEHVLCELLGPGIGHVRPYPLGVKTRLVHAHKPYGGEMVVEAAQIPLGIGVQALIHKAGDYLPLYVEAAGRDVHHSVQPCVEVRLVAGQIGYAGKVDGNDAH